MSARSSSVTVPPAANRELPSAGTVVEKNDYGWGSVLCGSHEMRTGRHYATFTLRSLGWASVGVAGPDFVPDHTRYGGPLASGCTQGWLLNVGSGNLVNGNRRRAWKGMPTELKAPSRRSRARGDVVVRFHAICAPAPTF